MEYTPPSGIAPESELTSQSPPSGKQQDQYTLTMSQSQIPKEMLAAQVIEVLTTPTTPPTN
jgi:hypothetical protein